MFKLGKSSFVLLLLAFITCDCALAVAEEAAKRLYLSEKDSSSSATRLSSMDMIKAVNENCSNVVITNDRGKADYVLETGSAWCCTPRGESRGYKFTLFNKDGDAMYATKTHTLGSAVKDVCNAMNAGKPKR
jgi:hypothetical protein